jgi:hypothetical protein
MRNPESSETEIANKLKNCMNKKLKLCGLALLAAVAAATARAETTNLLQAVTVQFTYYYQGTPGTDTAGNVVNIVEKSSFDTKKLIDDISASGTNKAGDVLVRVTPVTNVVLVAVSTTNLVITNTSTSNTNINYDLVYGGTTNPIGATNVTFGTNIAVIDGASVTLNTNTAAIGTNTPPLVIGTNTTVTVTTLTNEIGVITGTNYAFVINALSNVPGTNKLGAAYWAIYNSRASQKLTKISPSASFSIDRDRIYTLTNSAYISGEVIKKNGVIVSGTTEDIRSMTLSNSTSQIRLNGYAHGRVVRVSLGKTASAPVVKSSDYTWTGSGSGVVGGTNNTPIIIEGTIGENYLGLLTD